MIKYLVPSIARADFSAMIGTSLIGSIIAGGYGVLHDQAGLLGYGYGLWRGPNADYSAYEEALVAHRITDSWAFIRVAYIHNASYLGGLIGLIAALAMIRPTASIVTD